jgi:hypothetical protein
MARLNAGSQEHRAQSSLLGSRGANTIHRNITAYGKFPRRVLPPLECRKAAEYARTRVPSLATELDTAIERAALHHINSHLLWQ